MALPAVLLKAKGMVKKGAALHNAAKQAKNLTSDGEEFQASLFNKLKLPLITGGTLLFIIILPLLVIVAVPFVLATALFGGGNNGINNGINTGTVLTLDEATLESYYQASEAANRSNNLPDTDLAATNHKNVEGFNQYIKNQVNKAGYGTRAGVVTAGISLVGDYILSTGKRLRYSQGSRQESDVEGIKNKNFYLDCSSFAWWAVYNGGYKMPSYPQTLHQMAWASGYNSLESSIINGKPGDFLVNEGHIVLILGSYDGGYYCAEFAGTAPGAKISKRSIVSLSGSRYQLINMDKYYNDPVNIR